MIDPRKSISRHGNWIGQDLQAVAVPHVEAWRLFTSGQFLHRRIVTTDLRDAAQLRPEAPDATRSVAVWDVLLYFVEVAELGARFATSLGADTITIDLALENVAGRELISGDAPTLLTAPRSTGVDLTQQLLRQFGLTVSDMILDEWQDKALDPTSR